MTRVPPSSWHTAPHTLSTGQGSLPPGTGLGWPALLQRTHLPAPTSLLRNGMPAGLHPAPRDQPANSKGRAFLGAPLSQPGVCISNRVSRSDGDRPSETVRVCPSNTGARAHTRLRGVRNAAWPPEGLTFQFCLILIRCEQPHVARWLLQRKCRPRTVPGVW